MRALASLIMLLATASGCATTQTLSGDVDYKFVDQNGLGWATLDGEVRVTLTFDGKDGSLKISGKQRWVDAVLTDESPEGASLGLDTSNKWEGDVDQTFALLDVTRTRKTITFELDAAHDHLTGSCAPTTIVGLDRTTLYDCRIAGFGWHTIAKLPELHHPIVLDADTEANTRIVNSMTGSTRAGYGQRIVSDE